MTLTLGLVVLSALIGAPNKTHAFTPDQQFQIDEITRQLDANRYRIEENTLWLQNHSPDDLNYSVYQKSSQDLEIQNQQLLDKYAAISATDVKATETKVAAVEARAGECDILKAGTWGTCAKIAVSWIFAIILWLFTRILWFANEIFNQAINVSVRTFSTYADNSGPVGTSWGVIRDLVNMGFIFVLLYIAIGTMLELSGIDWKKLVPKLIIVALLVNFSAFFTRVIIDVSNVTANQFYLSAAVGKTAGGSPDVITTLMKNVAIFGTTLAPDKAKQEFSGPNIDGKVVNPGGLDWSRIITGFLGGIIISLVASFVLLTGAILFIIRTLRLLFLIILSPFAFFFFILPKTAKYGEQWWGALINDATFAPAFLIMIYIVTQITRALGELGGTGIGWVGETISFMLIIGLLLGAIIVAKALGAAGAKGAMKLAGRANAALAGGALWGLKQARRATTGVLTAPIPGTPDIPKTSQFLKKYSSSTFKDIGADVQKAYKESGQSKIAKAYKAVVKAPGQTFLTKTSDIIADQTESFGVSSGFLGDTDKQRREAEKARKDAKEAEKEAKLEQTKQDINRLRLGTTEAERKEAKGKVEKINDKDIVKIDNDSLVRLATLLSDKQMAALEKEIDPDKFNKVKTAREKPLADVLGYDDKGKRDETKTIDELKLLAELNKMSHQTIAKLPEEIIRIEEVIKKLVPDDIKEMRKAGVSGGTIDEVVRVVRKIGTSHPAHKYVNSSPGRGITVRGVPGNTQNPPRSEAPETPEDISE
ncbi:MAG TPA: hypothetical protein VJB69_02015 [Candidatus Paceibacterota bacterium]